LKPVASSPQTVGRYALYEEIASGGMATVHYGRLLGPVGFSRTVAIKRLHAQFAKDPEFAAMFLDEARLAARIRHPNVVPTLDVVAADGELLLVMDYVHGESLAQCLRVASAAKTPIPIEVVSAIACAVLHGLHAAHEATSEQGEPLSIVHRDVSPQNVLVGADGVPRVLDFGVAKAAGRMQTTREGQLKGKLAYMAPEQLESDAAVDRRTDVYAAGVVLWETLTRQRLFSGDNEAIVIRNVLERRVEAPSAVAQGVPDTLDAVTLRAVERNPSRRFGSAREMALEIEAAVPVASAPRVAQWLEGLVGERMARRARAVSSIESHSGRTSVPHEPDALDEAETRVMPSPADAGANLSQVSSVSVATSHTEPTARDHRWRWGASIAGLAGVGLLLLLLARLGAHDHPAPAATSSSDPSAVASSATIPPSAPAPSTPDPSTTAAALAPPAPSVSTVAAPPTTSQSPRPVPGARPCTITSYIDDSGIKHFAKKCR
jgi:eukaryotic-like serine/threonine-protein kinase